MYQENYFNSFIEEYNSGDQDSATISLMKELGKILVNNRQDFVNLLNETGIPATITMPDSVLVDSFIKNAADNPRLALGTSMLINMQNKMPGFDGEDEGLNDDTVKAAYASICNYFRTSNVEGTMGSSEDYDAPTIGGTMASSEENYFNSVGAIAGAVTAGAGLADTIAKGQQKKKYGALDALSKQREARTALMQQVLVERQAQAEADAKKAEAKAKTNKALIIGAAIVIGLGLATAVFFALRKNKGTQ